jgi:hypothetical protein
MVYFVALETWALATPLKNFAMLHASIGQQRASIDDDYVRHSSATLYYSA